ncbi:MAG: dTDP-4-dehydrorhamnose 3,5-epimerase [Saprospiraceae bacterium]
MNIIDTGIKDLLVLEPRVFEDERGYFFESYNESTYPDFSNPWVQDNESKSNRGVLRGLHYQIGGAAQAKLVRAITGEIYDVAVDLRETSDTYGKWYGTMLTASNKRQMYVPRGFAHGFVVVSETAIFAYKCDNYYNKEGEGGIIYNDLSLGIDWPIESSELLLSSKDLELPAFGDHLK